MRPRFSGPCQLRSFHMTSINIHGTVLSPSSPSVILEPQGCQWSLGRQSQGSEKGSSGSLTVAFLGAEPSACRFRFYKQHCMRLSDVAGQVKMPGFEKWEYVPQCDFTGFVVVVTASKHLLCAEPSSTSMG